MYAVPAAEPVEENGGADRLVGTAAWKGLGDGLPEVIGLRSEVPAGVAVADSNGIRGCG